MQSSGKNLTVSSLEMYNTLLDVGAGWLHIQGDYGIYADSRLYMTNHLGRVTVQGDFETLSSYSHRGCLTDGLFELYGNLVQGGTNYSFAISDNFMLDFMQELEERGGKVASLTRMLR